MAIDALLDGPIPGENYTSDTKNYPWHRPPDIVDIDEAIQWSIENLTEEEAGFAMLSLIEAGTDIVTAADIFVTIGIAKGKWTPDFAILLAGPVARVLEIMAKAYEVEYKLGLEKRGPRMTSAFLKAAREGRVEPVDMGGEEAATEAPPAPIAAGGLMGAPMAGLPAPEDEQMSMLGYGPEEEPPMDTPIEEQQ